MKNLRIVMYNDRAELVSSVKYEKPYDLANDYAYDSAVIVAESLKLDPNLCPGNGFAIAVAKGQEIRGAETGIIFVCKVDFGDHSVKVVQFTTYELE